MCSSVSCDTSMDEMYSATSNVDENQKVARNVKTLGNVTRLQLSEHRMAWMWILKKKISQSGCVLAFIMPPGSRTKFRMQWAVSSAPHLRGPFAFFFLHRHRSITTQDDSRRTENGTYSDGTEVTHMPSPWLLGTIWQKKKKKCTFMIHEGDRLATEQEVKLFGMVCVRPWRLRWIFETLFGNMSS